jgi:hypothetical protein
MRYTAMVALYLFFGAAMLTTSADPSPAQDKDDPPLKAPYTEHVKLEGIAGGKVEYTTEKVPACVVGKEPLWRIKSLRAVPPKKGDRLTDKDGKAYSVLKAQRIANGDAYLLTTDPAPKAPQPES